MADSVKQELVDQVAHFVCAALASLLLVQFFDKWYAIGFVFGIGLGREFVQHRAHFPRLGWGSALDMLVITIGAFVGTVQV